MGEKGREYWYNKMIEILREKEESNGVDAIRADLCSQIIDMPKDILFELCMDIASLPDFWLGLPEAAAGYKVGVNSQETGIALDADGEIDYEAYKQKFWDDADQYVKISK